MPDLREMRTERKKLWDRANELLSLPTPTQEQINEANSLLTQVDERKKTIEVMERAYDAGQSFSEGTRAALPVSGGDDRDNRPPTSRVFQATSQSRTIYGSNAPNRERAIARLGGIFVEMSEVRFLQRFKGIDDSGELIPGGAEKARQYEGAFARWIRARETTEDRAVMQSGFDAIESRDLGVTTGASGGFIVPPQFLQQLVEAQLAYGGMRAAGTIINTSGMGGADLPVPTDNDTAAVGAILAEAGAVPVDVTNPVMGQTVLHSYMYTSKLLKVSLQLLQDAFFPVEPYLARKLAIRLARIQNTHFTVGTGTAQPNGIVTAAFLGKTGLVGQTLLVIYDDLVDLMHSVDPAYRSGPGQFGLPPQPNIGSGVPTPSTRWMFRDLTLAAIRKIKDSQGRPIWAPGLGGFAGPMPDTIFGFPYIVNQDVAAMGANAKSILFGDFSNYFIRDALDVQVLRLNERFADNLQVAFVAFQRSDGNLIDAGTHPVKYYANSAT